MCTVCGRSGAVVSCLMGVLESPTPPPPYGVQAVSWVFGVVGFWGVPQTKEQVVKHGPSSLILNACHFTGWDAGKNGELCIRADGGRMVVSGCEFMDAGKKEIVLEKGLKAATITGCLLRGKDGIVNESEGDVQVGMNTTQ